MTTKSAAAEKLAELNAKLIDKLADAKLIADLSERVGRLEASLTNDIPHRFTNLDNRMKSVESWIKALTLGALGILITQWVIHAIR